MKTIKSIMILFLVWFFMGLKIANGQCPVYNCGPSGYHCNPNTGTAYISHTPQCYGDNYEITIAGTYDYGYTFLNGNGGWNLPNGTFAVNPGDIWTFELDATAFHGVC